MYTNQINTNDNPQGFAFNSIPQLSTTPQRHVSTGSNNPKKRTRSSQTLPAPQSISKKQKNEKSERQRLFKETKSRFNDLNLEFIKAYSPPPSTETLTQLAETFQKIVLKFTKFLTYNNETHKELKALCISCSRLSLLLNKLKRYSEVQYYANLGITTFNRNNLKVPGCIKMRLFFNLANAHFELKQYSDAKTALENAKKILTGRNFKKYYEENRIPELEKKLNNIEKTHATTSQHFTNYQESTRIITSHPHTPPFITTLSSSSSPTTSYINEEQTQHTQPSLLPLIPQHTTPPIVLIEENPSAQSMPPLSSVFPSTTNLTPPNSPLPTQELPLETPPIQQPNKEPQVTDNLNTEVLPDDFTLNPLFIFNDPFFDNYTFDSNNFLINSPRVDYFIDDPNEIFENS